MADRAASEALPAAVPIVADLSQAPLPAFTLVDNADAWADCLARLAQYPRLALDLESNSLYAYRDTVCLLQISTEDEDFIVDPRAPGVALEDMEPLLSDLRVEKVFHASEYDLMLLKREHGLLVQNLFDTMWAARILGHTHMGLAHFLRELFGVHQRKRYQKTDWAKRPLTEGQLAYAQADTHYLLRLRDYFAGELQNRGFWEEAQEIFTREARVRLPDRVFDPDDFWSLRGARDLSPRKRAVLRALYVWRDEEAQRRDQPPFKILNNDTLVHLAKALPEDLNALRRCNGLSDGQLGRYGRRLLRVIEQGKLDAAPSRPRRNERPDQDVSARYDALMQWRKQLAQERGVESDVILTRESLWRIAAANPATLEELVAVVDLGPFRKRLYAQAILDALACA